MKAEPKVVLEKPGIEPAIPDLQGMPMPCKSGVAGSIPGFSRTTGMPYKSGVAGSIPGFSRTTFG